MRGRIRQEALERAERHALGLMTRAEGRLFEAELKVNAELQAAVEYLDRERMIFEAWTEERLPQPDFDRAYARARANIDRARRRSEPAPGEAPWRWLDWLAEPRWRPALAMVLLLAIGQPIVIGLLASRQGSLPADDVTRSSGGSKSSGTMFVGVTFTPEAKEEDIRRLLLRLEAQVIAGPRPSGEYAISAPTRADGDLVALFKADPLVIDARLLGTPPDWGTRR